MCGLFGWFKPQLPPRTDKVHLLRHLARKAQVFGTKSFGLAYAAAAKPALIRYTGAASAWLAQNSKELPKHARSTIMIGHTRFPTRGEVRKGNCHPFSIGPWYTAHNGRISNSEELMMKAVYAAKGETDSEEALVYVAGSNFDKGALEEVEGSFAFEAIQKDGSGGLLICDQKQNLHYAKVGQGYIWHTSETALESTLRSIGIQAEIKALEGQILDLETGELTTFIPASSMRRYTGSTADSSAGTGLRWPHEEDDERWFANSNDVPEIGADSETDANDRGADSQLELPKQ